MNSNSVNKLSRKIKDNYNSFTKTEKKIADYFLENRNSVAFQSIHEFAKKLKVGTGSVMRFASKMGYDGFASLKKDLTELIREDLTPLDKFKLLLEQPNPTPNTIEQIARNEVKNINSLLNNFDEEKFKKIVNILLKAENIFTMGLGLSTHLANLTSYMLRRIGIKSFALNKLGITFSDQLVPVSKKDVLIAYSFPKYSKETINAAKYFYENKAKVIGVTNKLTAPVVEFSTEYMLVKTNSEYIAGSIGAVSVFIYALVNDLAIKDKQRAKNAIDDIISKRL